MDVTECVTSVCRQHRRELFFPTFLSVSFIHPVDKDSMLDLCTDLHDSRVNHETQAGQVSVFFPSLKTISL